MCMGWLMTPHDLTKKKKKRFLILQISFDFVPFNGYFKFHYFLSVVLEGISKRFSLMINYLVFLGV